MNILEGAQEFFSEIRTEVAEIVYGRDRTVDAGVGKLALAPEVQQGLREEAPAAVEHGASAAVEADTPASDNVVSLEPYQAAMQRREANYLVDKQAAAQQHAVSSDAMREYLKEIAA